MESGGSNLVVTRFPWTLGSISVRNGEVAATYTTSPMIHVGPPRDRVIAEEISGTDFLTFFRTDTMIERNSHNAVTIQTRPANQYSTSAGFQ